jgi:HEAT repeat protein
MQARNALILVSLVAGIGLLIPGSPAYVPSLLSHYSHFEDGHSLGYWLRALDRPEARMRLQAIVALGRLGADAEEAVPALARILTEDDDVKARQQAALALAKMAPASAAAVPALARAVEEDPVAIVRMNAVIALMRSGTLARPAVPALIRAMQSRVNRTNLAKFTFSIQEAAAAALGRATAGTSEGVAALTEALRIARTANKRRVVASALAEIGTPAREAEPLVRELLTDPNPEVRQAAQEALEKLQATRQGESPGRR